MFTPFQALLLHYYDHKNYNTRKPVALRLEKVTDYSGSANLENSLLFPPPPDGLWLAHA